MDTPVIESIQKFLRSWKTTTTDRAKLQQTYMSATIVLVLLAGIVGLVNYDLGQGLLAAAAASIGVFFVNAIVWSLLQSALLLRLETRKSVPRKKK
jgi:tellurite resistance protein TehA-like permease